MEVSGQLHALAAYPRGKNLGIHDIESWVSSRAGLLPLPGIEPRPLLYWLRYPDCYIIYDAFK
jgi:hypothetical protein